MNELTTLNNINIGEHAVVFKVNNKGAMRRRLLDLGLVEGTDVECVGKSPSGDPSAYLIRGAVIALRHDDGRGVTVLRG